jgi:S-adenosylmethionine decarboxylase
MEKITLGTQYLVEFFGCCKTTINDRNRIREIMIEAANRARATIVADVFHEFNPHGISGVVVIAESHIAIHSWPEHSCASVDIFTCSAEMNPEAAVSYLETAFKAEKIEMRKISRGVVDPCAFGDEAIA